MNCPNPKDPNLTNPARRKQVRRVVLEALRHASPYALTREVLESHVNDLIRPPLSFGEWGVTEQFLEAGKFIAAIRSDIDPDMKLWAITDLGKTLLATL